MDASLLEGYRRVIGTYQKIEPIVVSRIENLCKERGFFLMMIQSRVKQESSFAEKTIRKSDIIHSISDVTDLLGCRIICYFSDDVDKIVRALADIFDLDQKNSIDKRKVLSANQFGYMAVHLICSLKPEEGLPEGYTDCRFEIQVKTVLQHVWAEIEHDLGYKSEFGIPDELRRRFSMSASLMELADREFLGIRDASKTYAEEMETRIGQNDADDISINVVSLSQFMQNNRFMLSFYERVRQECGVDIIHSNNSSLIPMLARVNVDTLGELEKLLKLESDHVIGQIREQVANRGLDIASDRVILKALLEQEMKWVREARGRFI